MKNSPSDTAGVALQVSPSGFVARTSSFSAFARNTIVSPIFHYIDTYRTFGFTPGNATVDGDIAKDVGFTSASITPIPGGLCGGEEVLVTVAHVCHRYASPPNTPLPQTPHQPLPQLHL